MTRSASTATTRRERRAAEHDARRQERRERRRASQQRTPRWSLTTLSLAAVGLGLAGVIGIALITAPKPPIELNEPLAWSPSGLAEGMALGKSDAPLTIELWSDYQCPACGQFTQTMEPALVADYVVPGKVRLVYRDLAFLGSESIDAAVAARAAGETNQYWPFHDYLFANQRGEQQGAFSQARLEAIATALGMDLATFRANQADPAVRQAVADTGNEGARLGISSTPTLVIGDQRITGVPPSYAALQAVIDEALAEADPGAE